MAERVVSQVFIGRGEALARADERTPDSLRDLPLYGPRSLSGPAASSGGSPLGMLAEARTLAERLDSHDLLMTVPMYEVTLHTTGKSSLSRT